MTQEKLCRLGILKEELRQDLERLRRLQEEAVGYASYFTGMPKSKEKIDKVGEYAAAIADLETVIQEKMCRCIREEKELMVFIRDIDDSLIRVIMTLRYGRGMTWQQVAMSIGEYDEQYPRRKHNAYLKKYQEEKMTKKTEESWYDGTVKKKSK